MSSVSAIGPLFNRVLLHIRRDRTSGFTLAMLVCLMLLAQMLFTFLVGVRAVGHLLTDRSALQLEVLSTAREQDIQELYAALRIHPSVREVTFLSKEQVYERQKALHPEDVAFLEQYDFDNPFPDVFSVTLTSLESYNALAADLQTSRWKQVVDPSFLTAGADHEQEIRTLLQVTDGLTTLSIVFMVVMFLLLCAAVFEWVSRAAARRGHEPRLAHLLGASSFNVLLPFALEMTVLLLAAAVIAALLMGAILFLLPVFMPAFALEAPFRALQTEAVPLLYTALPIFLLVQIVVIPALSFAGTIVGVRSKLPVSFSFSA